jgi:hypothetical protein
MDSSIISKKPILKWIYNDSEFNQAESKFQTLDNSNSVYSNLKQELDTCPQLLGLKLPKYLMESSKNRKSKGPHMKEFFTERILIKNEDKLFETVGLIITDDKGRRFQIYHPGYPLTGDKVENLRLTKKLHPEQVYCMIPPDATMDEIRNNPKLFTDENFFKSFFRTKSGKYIEADVNILEELKSGCYKSGHTVDLHNQKYLESVDRMVPQFPVPIFKSLRESSGLTSNSKTQTQEKVEPSKPSKDMAATDSQFQSQALMKALELAAANNELNEKNQKKDEESGSDSDDSESESEQEEKTKEEAKPTPMEVETPKKKDEKSKQEKTPAKAKKVKRMIQTLTLTMMKRKKRIQMSLMLKQMNILKN